MQSNTEFTYSEGKKQKIKFTLFAPSGSGGGIISEILDDNRSQQGDTVNGNLRNEITNEYAGSKNCYRYHKYESHYMMNEFPEWNEDLILYGKDISPIKFYKHCKINSPVLYYIDVTGHEFLLKELVYMKKFVGGTTLAQGIGRHLQTTSARNIDYKRETSIVNDKDALTLFEHRINAISKKYFDGLLHPHSPIASAVMMNNHLDPSHITEVEFRRELVNTYRLVTHANPQHWKNLEEVSEYTKVHVIKYDDLLNGRDTDTKLDDHKDELKDYFDRNEELIESLHTSLTL
jgi:hypothetical protein